ncbi:MAG: hypothetical protein GY714_20110 [Desulfobacterales bacterium]|nr:hypothetical protein [Desulfobacterales bacterium]
MSFTGPYYYERMRAAEHAREAEQRTYSQRTYSQRNSAGIQYTRCDRCGIRTPARMDYYTDRIIYCCGQCGHNNQQNSTIQYAPIEYSHGELEPLPELKPEPKTFRQKLQDETDEWLKGVKLEL